MEQNEADKSNRHKFHAQTNKGVVRSVGGKAWDLSFVFGEKECERNVMRPGVFGSYIETIIIPRVKIKALQSVALKPVK